MDQGTNLKAQADFIWLSLLNPFVTEGGCKLQFDKEIDNGDYKEYYPGHGQWGWQM